MGTGDVEEFVEGLSHLRGDQLQRVADSLAAGLLTDEVDWWRATIAIDKVLRHARRTRVAGRAANDAVRAVQNAARDAGYVLPDPDMTRVARAAADMARGLVAGPAARPVLRLLAEHWQPVGAGV
jgi:hypothetical protein